MRLFSLVFIFVFVFIFMQSHAQNQDSIPEIIVQKPYESTLPYMYVNGIRWTGISNIKDSDTLSIFNHYRDMVIYAKQNRNNKIYFQPKDDEPIVIVPSQYNLIGIVIIHINNNKFKLSRDGMAVINIVRQ